MKQYMSDGSYVYEVLPESKLKPIAVPASCPFSTSEQREELQRLMTQANMAVALLNAAKVAMGRITALRPNEAHEALSEVVALAEKNCP